MFHLPTLIIFNLFPLVYGYVHLELNFFLCFGLGLPLSCVLPLSCLDPSILSHFPI
jgi:hypothetical protein